MTVHDEAVAQSGWSVTDVLRRIVWGHKTLVAGFVVLGTAGGLAWASSAPTTYQAGTELVTGTYSVPQEVGLDEALDGAGPLGLELPAETQARILTSPAVVSLAVTALALDEDASLELLTTASARPITDNVFTVSAAGPTPADAAQRANAVAAAYLDYRQARATEKLSPLRDEALARAATAESAFAGLQPRIESAQSADDLALAATLVAQQEELELIRARENALAGTIESWLQSFGGGGTVVRPADAGDAVGGVSTSRIAAAGLLAGLMLGLGTAFLLERVRSPLRTARDVADVVGRDVAVLNERGDRTGVIAARTIWRHRTPTAADPWDLAVVPAVEGRDVGRVARWLASGLESLGHRTVLDSRDPVGDASDVRDAAEAGETRETDDAPGAGGVPKAPEGARPHDVRITEVVDVATLCLDVAAAADDARDVIVTVTLGKDSTRALTDTVDALSATGLTLVAVMLRSRRDRGPGRFRLQPRRWRRRAAGPALPGEAAAGQADDDHVDGSVPTAAHEDDSDDAADVAAASSESHHDAGADGTDDDRTEDDEAEDDDATRADGTDDDEAGSALVADAAGGRGGRRR